MKKLILAISITACVASTFAQGTIVFGNRIPNSVVAPIYGPNPFDPWIVQQGNSADGFPAGTTVYAGAPLGTRAGDFQGSFTAELWAGQTPFSLAPVAGADAQIITRGFFTTLGTPVAIPGVAEGGTAYLQLRAWDNRGGTITSWAQVIASGFSGIGMSAIFSSAPLGGAINLPPDLVGLTSFNIVYGPEPSTLALAGLGAVVLLVFRRLNR
jgi:hypothetical protein